MGALTAAELKRIEREYAAGVTSAMIVELFKARGERFSEPTLRKYVQIGLLPKSRRVGTRGRHRGSTGLYPVSVVRLIGQIKEALDNGATLEEIRVGVVGLGGELATLQRAAEQALRRFEEAIDGHADAKRRRSLAAILSAQRRSLQRDLRELQRLAERVSQGTSGRVRGAEE